MKTIEILQEDLAALRKELREVQENQINLVSQLSSVEDLEELDEKIENMTRDFEQESEELFKEIVYINKEIFKQALSQIWEDAKRKGVALNV